MSDAPHPRRTTRATARAAATAGLSTGATLPTAQAPRAQNRGTKRTHPDDSDDSDDDNPIAGTRKKQYIQKGKQVVGLLQTTQNVTHSPFGQPSASGTGVPATITGRDSFEVPVRVWEFENADGTVGGELDVLEELRPERRVAWLASSKNWGGPWFGAKWVGEKVLGLGGNGLVGVWAHSDPESEEITRERPAKVVVKQTKQSDKSLKAEAKMLRLIKDQTGSKHVVGIYGDYYEEVGQGTITTEHYNDYPMDPRTVVGRIYLEYCENGDMMGLIRKAYDKYSDENPVPEEMVWSIFGCLARGLCVLAYGNENPDGEAWKLQQIGHFDLKIENIFGGAFDEDHVKYYIMKIADFGHAIQLPKQAGAQTAKWFNANKILYRGTRGYKPPEQTDKSMRGRYAGLGTKSNVWQVAKCIYELIRLGREFDLSKTFQYGPDLSGPLIRTFGRKLATKGLYDCYSAELKKLVLRCLAYDFADRPDPKEILRTCQRALGDIKMMVAARGSVASGAVASGSIQTRYPEPGDGMDWIP